MAHNCNPRQANVGGWGVLVPVSSKKDPGPTYYGMAHPAFVCSRLRDLLCFRPPFTAAYLKSVLEHSQEGLETSGKLNRKRKKNKCLVSIVNAEHFATGFCLLKSYFLFKTVYVCVLGDGPRECSAGESEAWDPRSWSYRQV